MPTAKAGWSQVDITPPLGLPLGGRGPRFSLANEVLDPLVAQVLLMEDAQGTRLMWISLDLIGLSYRSAAHLRYSLAAITNTPYDHVIINFSHTHSGPMANFDKYAALVAPPLALLEYDNTLHDNLIRAAAIALEQLLPVDINIFRGHSHIGINRRHPNAQGVMELRPNPAGYYNSELWLLELKSSSASALIFNYGCHPILVYGFAWNAISADFPGICRRYLHQYLDAGTHCQFIQGLAGNVRPRVVADLDNNRFRQSSPTDLEYCGQQLANDICLTLSLTPEVVELSIKATAGHFLAGRDQQQIPSRQYFQQLANSDDELERNLGKYWITRLDSGIPPLQSMPWAIGLLQLSKNQHIAYLSGEVLVEWQNHIRTWLADDTLLLWGYCQEVPCYLPTDELLDEGGYEITTSNLYGKEGPGPFAKGLNATVKQAFGKLAKQLN